jgi:hypothetical protein
MENAERFFESVEPLRLRTFQVKEKNKALVARRIAEEFEAGRTYTEFEVKEVLAPICEDHATVRRYLVDHGLLARTPDCSAYWKPPSEEVAGAE